MSKLRARRALSAILLVVVCLMVISGVRNMDALKTDPNRFVLYWFVVGVLLLCILVFVVVDLLVLRMAFVKTRLKILQETIADPVLQKKLADAQAGKQDQPDSNRR